MFEEAGLPAPPEAEIPEPKPLKNTDENIENGVITSGNMDPENGATEPA